MIATMTSNITTKAIAPPPTPRTMIFFVESVAHTFPFIKLWQEYWIKHIEDLYINLYVMKNEDFNDMIQTLS